MNDDRRVPTPAEFEKAISQSAGGKFLRFFKRTKRFQVKQGVGESKDVLQTQRLTWPPPVQKPAPVSPVAESKTAERPAPTVTSPAPISFERAPAPTRKPPSRRPINISPEVRAQRASSAAAASSGAEETDWAPSWPPGISEAEMRKRIGPTQNYMEPD